MTHLTQLKKINYLYAAFNGAIGVACLVGLLWLAATTGEADPTLAWIFAGSGVGTFLLVAAFSVLFVVTGKKVEIGKWRMVQTVLAMLSIGSNPPVGTIYGAYALYVCWSDPDAKARFDSQGAPPTTRPADLGKNTFYKWTRGIIVGFGAFFVLLTGVTLIGTGYLLDWGGTEHDVHVTAQQVEITGMYGDTIDRDAISKVELRDELPQIKLRTNGYALGGTLKGWFSTQDMDDVLLFVHTDSPPYVYMKTDDRWTVVGFKDSARTQALYADLTEAP